MERMELEAVRVHTLDVVNQVSHALAASEASKAMLPELVQVAVCWVAREAAGLAARRFAYTQEFAGVDATLRRHYPEIAGHLHAMDTLGRVVRRLRDGLVRMDAERRSGCHGDYMEALALGVIKGAIVMAGPQDDREDELATLERLVLAGHRIGNTVDGSVQVVDPYGAIVVRPQPNAAKALATWARAHPVRTP